MKRDEGRGETHKEGGFSGDARRKKKKKDPHLVGEKGLRACHKGSR